MLGIYQVSKGRTRRPEPCSQAARAVPVLLPLGLVDLSRAPRLSRAVPALLLLGCIRERWRYVASLATLSSSSSVLA